MGTMLKKKKRNFIIDMPNNLYPCCVSSNSFLILHYGETPERTSQTHCFITSASYFGGSSLALPHQAGQLFGEPSDVSKFANHNRI